MLQTLAPIDPFLSGGVGEVLIISTRGQTEDGDEMQSHIFPGRLMSVLISDNGLQKPQILYLPSV